MESKGTIGVGLIGLGVVGGGVVRLLQDRADYFRSARGVEFALKKVAVRDLSKPRDVALPDGCLTDQTDAVTSDPDVHIVVEVMGGIEPAQTVCREALENGKDVVTANKALLAEHGHDLFRTASEHGGMLAFEASVCGGIPIIQAMLDGLVANEIETIFGILNGTTNYILTRMTDEGGAFEGMLQQAQEKGFAEADPTMDIDGTDAAQKLALLCRIAFDVGLRPSDILKEGISHITPTDVRFARELGYTIKLLAIAKSSGDRRIEARVHPALIPSGSLLANIKDEFNAVEIVGSAVGPQVFTGRGAGRLPTASAVVSDLVDLAEHRLTGRTASRSPLAALEAALPIPADQVRASFYCRFEVQDRPGVLARIAKVFFEHEISIAKVIQEGRSKTEEGAVPLIMTTHEAAEAAMHAAVREIDGLPMVREKAQVIRIEEL